MSDNPPQLGSEFDATLLTVQVAPDSDWMSDGGGPVVETDAAATVDSHAPWVRRKGDVSGLFGCRVEAQAVRNRGQRTLAGINPAADLS
jgi:hypothetical protein